MANRSKMLPLAAGLGFLLMLPLFFMDFSGGGDYPQLEKAISGVRYMSAPRQLQRSSFRAIFPEGKPSDFVGWMFSELGAAEWPPSEMELMDEEERRAIRAIGMPILPQNVEIRQEINPQGGRQVIVRGDDRQKKIMVEGHLLPEQGPVLTREWAFPGPGPS